MTKPFIAAPYLTDIEQRVLEWCTRSRVTISAVLLATQMWEASKSARERDAFGADPYGLVEFVLAGLNEAGLVVYSLSPHGGVPIHIRVTDEGYAACGYRARPVAVVGPKRSYDEPPRHPDDRTDFRTHKRWAEASACQRCSLAEHLDEYPDHLYTTPGGF